MIDELTPASVASEVFMQREDSGYQGIFLFVEGETDAILFSTYCDNKCCIVRSVKGRENVLKLMEIVESRGENCCLAIVDADFWHIENKNPPSENVLMTDTHDIETMIFKTSALEKVLCEHLSTSRLQSLFRKFPDIRLPILSVAQKMAVIRLVNHLHRIGINFHADQNGTENIEWEDAIDIENFRVNIERLLDIVCSDDYGRKFRIKPLIRKHITQDYDLYELCNGHDVVYVTWLFLRRKGRPRDVQNLTVKELEKMFRLAYEVIFFKETNLYSQIMAWQERKGIYFVKI